MGLCYRVGVRVSVVKLRPKRRSTLTVKLTLKPCAPKVYHEGQCEGERECGGRKCPQTHTQTLCAKGVPRGAV